MDWKTRIHEWLADRISWVQYPQIKPVRRGSRGNNLWLRYQNMPRRKRAWVWVGAFYGGLVLLSLYGNFVA